MTAVWTSRGPTIGGLPACLAGEYRAGKLKNGPQNLGIINLAKALLILGRHPRLHRQSSDISPQRRKRGLVSPGPYSEAAQVAGHAVGVPRVSGRFANEELAKAGLDQRRIKDRENRGKIPRIISGSHEVCSVVAELVGAGLQRSRAKRC